MLIVLIVACCGQALADGKVTYSSDVHPFKIYSLKSFYDIDGDGILEVVGSTDYNYFVSKVTGKRLKCVPSEYNRFEYFNSLGILLTKSYGRYFLQYNTGNEILQEDPRIGYHSIVNDYVADFSCSGFQYIIGKINKNDSIFSVWKEQKDGNLYKTFIRYTEDIGFLHNNAISNYTPSNGGSGIGSIADDMFIKSKENTFTQWDDETFSAKKLISKSPVNLNANNNQVEDLNGDGLIDFTYDNYIYYNLGNDMFFKSPHKGKLYPADLNNDGLMDYVDFTGDDIDLYMMQSDGKLSEKETLFSNSSMQGVYFGDFDKDDDVDILVIASDNAATYTVFFRNDGNGKFKRKESYIDGTYSCFDCKDYDADGLYELLVSSQDNKDYLLKCGKDFSVSLTALPDGDNKILADFNRDGITEINSRTTYTVLPNAKKNTRPDKMDKPMAVFLPEEGKLRITWSRGNDAQTSSCDLTYELRIGTAPGKGDILFGHALTDGTRRNLSDGNMRHALKHLLDASFLKEGKYYIAVQAIDAGNMGGEWSEEFVYDHQVVMTPVIAPVPTFYSTADTINLKVTNSRDDATYKWNINHGRIISQSANGDNINAVFESSLDLSAMVEMTLNNKNYTSKKVEFFLVPAKSQEFSLDYIKKNIQKEGIDLDQDGNVEIYNSGFYKYVKGNQYEKVKKSWNTDLSSNLFVVDYNKDGYPDFFSDCKKGDTYINGGEQDFEFEYFTTGDAHYDGIWEDKNNDGNYQFTTFYPGRFATLPTLNYLVNGDYEAKEYHAVAYDEGITTFNMVNKKDGTSKLVSLPIVSVYKNYVSGYLTFIDLDNNGYVDIINNVGDALLLDKDFSYKKIKFVERGYKGEFEMFYWRPFTRFAYPLGLLSNIKNEAPKAPQYVSAQQTEDGLLLKWADAEDDHTPAVQMRYNVSVKRKNKKVGEENAFLISPLNGLSDEAAICSNVAYRKATQMLIPKATLTNGETLEVQVQSIDLMGEHSPMTKPVEVTINNDGYIKVKDSHVTASLGTVVSFVGTKGTSYSIDGGEGATIKKDYGKGEYLVAWNTPGTKKVTITVDGKVYSTNIIAYDFADLTLHFPAKVLRNTPITVKVPKVFSQYSPIDYGFKAADNYVVRYEKGDSTATFTFKNSGEVKVCAFCKFDNSELSKENNVNVIDASMPTAKISEVIGDGANYRISWQPASNVEIAKVEISRETNRMNQYEVLATVDMNVGTYLDETSDNRIQAHRYRIRYIASNEVQTSAYSTPHNPLHVMINQCGNGYNLMWNAYEGMNVESYTILRGTSEDNLQPIEYVAGSQQSYTDLTAKAGKYYYAVTFTPASSSTYAKSRAARTNYGIRSNVVSTEEALPTTLATSIAINCVESNNSLTNTQQTIHLYGVVLPTYSTYSRVSWSVVRNDDLASISNNGVLTAKGGRGLVTVRATTLDGSNLYVDYDVACNVDKEAAGIVIVEKDGVAADNKPTIYYDLEGRRIETPAKGHLYITNKGQKIMF